MVERLINKIQQIRQIGHKGGIIMGDINVQEFPDSLTEEQRAAVPACKKGILPFILLGIMAFSVGLVGPAVTVSAAKVCLTEDIKGKGKKGDIIDVSDGYAYNFLIPKGMAVLATKEVLLEKKSKDDAESYHKEQEIEKKNVLAKFLNGKSITLYRKSGENGKLFGSITTKELANAIESTYNIYIDKRNLNVPEIKNFGSYEIKVNLGMDVSAYMTVNVCQE